MKTSWLGSIAFVAVLGGSLANAADMPVKAPVYRAPPVVATHWTGCYVGANIGYGWQRNHTVDVVADPDFDAGRDTGKGIVGGGQVGCDYRSGSWVFGIQGMFNGADVDGSHRYTGGNSSPNETLGFQTQWFATLVARLGYAVLPQTLLYVKGGAAWVRIRYTDSDPGEPYFGSAQDTRSGWTVGTGAEYAFNRNWSLFAEYNYIELGRRQIGLTYDCGAACGFDNPYTYRTRHYLQTVLAGINYRFSSPVVARY